MTKPELGTKRRCNSCATKFFDLNKDPIICPKCAAVFVPPQPDPVRSRRLSERQPWSAAKDTVPEMADEVSVDETNADKEIKLPEAETEEVDGEVVLLDDQDGEVDATEVLDADIEKNDT